MTVYHGGSEVEVVAGNADENWAAITFPGDDRVIDVTCAQLAGDSGWDEIKRAIEEANEECDFDFQNQRVRVRFVSEEVYVETHSGKKLFHADFFKDLEECEDDYEFVTEVVMPALRAVDWANRQPSRLVWKHRDKFTEAEE